MNSKQRKQLGKRMLKLAKGLNSVYIEALKEVKSGDKTLDELITEFTNIDTLIKELS